MRHATIQCVKHYLHIKLLEFFYTYLVPICYENKENDNYYLDI